MENDDLAGLTKWQAIRRAPGFLFWHAVMFVAAKLDRIVPSRVAAWVDHHDPVKRFPSASDDWWPKYNPATKRMEWQDGSEAVPGSKDPTLP